MVWVGQSNCVVQVCLTFTLNYAPLLFPNDLMIFIQMHLHLLIVLINSVETNIYFVTNRISNIIRLMKIERIEYRILFAYQENIRILFEYLNSNKFAKKCKVFGIQNFHIPQKHLLIRKNFPHVDSHQ